MCEGGGVGAGESELDPTLISQAAHPHCSLDTRHSSSLEGISHSTHNIAFVLSSWTDKKKLYGTLKLCIIDTPKRPGARAIGLCMLYTSAGKANSKSPRALPLL